MIITCPKCGLWKLSDEFYKNAQSKNGYQSWCKECYKNHNETERTYTGGVGFEVTQEYKEQLMKQVTPRYADEQYLFIPYTVKQSVPRDYMIAQIYSPELIAVDRIIIKSKI